MDENVRLCSSCTFFQLEIHFCNSSVSGFPHPDDRTHNYRWSDLGTVRLQNFLFYLTFSDKHHGRTSRRNPRLYNKVHAPAPALCSHRNHDRRLADGARFFPGGCRLADGYLPSLNGCRLAGVDINSYRIVFRNFFLLELISSMSKTPSLLIKLLCPKKPTCL